MSGYVADNLYLCFVHNQVAEQNFGEVEQLAERKQHLKKKSRLETIVKTHSDCSKEERTVAGAKLSRIMPSDVVEISNNHLAKIRQRLKSKQNGRCNLKFVLMCA